MTVQTLLNTPIKQFALVMFIAGVSAIMFSRGITGWLLSDVSPLILVGVSIMLIAFIPIIARWKFFTPTFMGVIVTGLLFIFAGISMG